MTIIDKQKLLQWIENTKDVYSGPYEEFESQEECEGILKALAMLKRDIAWCVFEVDNGEEVKG